MSDPNSPAQQPLSAQNGQPDSSTPPPNSKEVPLQSDSSQAEEQSIDAVSPESAPVEPPLDFAQGGEPTEPALDETAPAVTEPVEPPLPILPGSVVCRYGVMKLLGLFSNDLERRLLPGMKVVVRTDHGVELAEVVATVDETQANGCLSCSKLTEFLAAAGAEYPFLRNGKILRAANSQDLIDQRHLNESAREEATFCRKQIRELQLPMKLVTVEHLLGGERIVFYFSSETRVDFRELVRRLASQFRTRIEMRQVGARDEAKLVADYERCGRVCCCRSFLKNLQPISMRMAKIQKATLDPSKISGRCGRLMCCLKFEDAGYEELRAKLPKKNIYVRTATAVGKVIDMQILTQLVRLLLPDGTQMVVGNEEIVERNVPAPPPQEIAAPTQGQSLVRQAIEHAKAQEASSARKTLDAEMFDAATAPDNLAETGELESQEVAEPISFGDDDNPAGVLSIQPQLTSPDRPANTMSVSSSTAQEGSKRRRHRRRRGQRAGQGQPVEGNIAAPPQPGPRQGQPQQSQQPPAQTSQPQQGEHGRRGRRRRRRRHRH